MLPYIPNMWYAVLDSDEVKPGKPVAFKRLGVDMVFWRNGEGKVVAMRDLCPHRQCKLSPGKVVDGNLQCHFHGFQYDSEGACQLVPANGRNGPKPRALQCTVYPTQEAHGFVWVWNGERRPEYPPVPFFDNLDGFVYATFQAHWNVHYTRAISSELDVSHLPFVHPNTIGRGQETLVNGPYTTLDEERNELRCWISNQPDAGLPARKPSQVPPPNRPATLWLNFPNVWQIYLGESFRNVIISAPVDDKNTVLYVRTYQNVVKTPMLGKLASRLSNVFNSYVLKEDEHIVQTQWPLYDDLDIGNFIPGDRPIALYLQRRRELIEAQANSKHLVMEMLNHA
jgi:phenylpropionate dioxygenase-like ring-hydroxylating dioxygenase large terminal subunit